MEKKIAIVTGGTRGMGQAISIGPARKITLFLHYIVRMKKVRRKHLKNEKLFSGIRYSTMRCLQSLLYGACRTGNRR